MDISDSINIHHHENMVSNYVRQIKSKNFQRNPAASGYLDELSDYFLEDIKNINEKI